LWRVWIKGYGRKAALKGSRQSCGTMVRSLFTQREKKRAGDKGKRESQKVRGGKSKSQKENLCAPRGEGWISNGRKKRNSESRTRESTSLGPERAKGLQHGNGKEGDVITKEGTKGRGGEGQREKIEKTKNKYNLKSRGGTIPPGSME